MADTIDITAMDLLESMAHTYDQATKRGFTRPELQSRLGWGERKTLAFINGLIKEGKVAAGFVQRENNQGIHAPRAGYYLTGA